MQTTGELPISKAREEIVAEAHRLEETLLYSAKGHLEASQLWAYYHWIIGLPLVALSAVANTPVLEDYTRYILFAVLLLSALSTFVDVQEKSGAAKQAGNSFDALMSKVRLFRTIECVSEKSDEVLTDKLAGFVEHKNRLNETSPGIPRIAYFLAKRSIMRGEADYTIDKRPKGPTGPTGIS